MDMATEAAPDTSLDDLEHYLHENVRLNVRSLIESRGVRRVDLYTALSMSKQVLSSRLSGASKFNAAEVRILAHLLGVPTDRLYEDPAIFIGETEGSPLQDRLQRTLPEVTRSRCFTLVEALPGQLELAFDDPPKLSVAR